MTMGASVGYERASVGGVGASRFTTDKAETSQTALQEIAARLNGVREDVSRLAARVQGAADRGLGGAPQPPSSNGSAKISAAGIVAEINEVISVIQNTLVYAHDEMARVERIA